jgi:hypothetical protein
MALLSVAVAAATIVRNQRRGAAECEFSLWFRLPPGSQMIVRDGWWLVVDDQRQGGVHRC